MVPAFLLCLEPRPMMAASYNSLIPYVYLVALALLSLYELQAVVVVYQGGA